MAKKRTEKQKKQAIDFTLSQAAAAKKAGGKVFLGDSKETAEVLMNNKIKHQKRELN